MSTHGLRRVVFVGSALNFSAAAVRWAAAFFASDLAKLHSAAPYACLLLGQCLAAIAQPCFTNTPTRLAGDWFAVEQRDIAASVGALVNPLGNAVGQILPSLLVSAPSHIPRLMAVCAGLAAVSATGVACFFAAEPEHPPSRSASRRRDIRSEDAVAGLDPWLLLKRDARGLLTDTEFIKLLLSFGLGLGFFNALLTVIEQLIRPCGYDSDQAGVLGGVVLGSGLVGAALATVAMETLHLYRPLLKTGLVTIAGGTAFMLLALRPDNFVVLLIAFATLGLFMLPMLPLTLQNAVECTYPIPEDSSAALLFLVGQFTGIAATLTLTKLLDDQGDKCGPITSPPTLFIASLIFVTALPVLFYNGQYKRLDHDRQVQALLHAVDEDGAAL